MKEILYVWAKGLKNSCGQCFSPSSPIHFYLSTVEPVLRGHRIKRTPSIKRTRTPKKYLKWSFLLLQACIKRTPPNMPDTGNAKDCHPQSFRFLHYKT